MKPSLLLIALAILIAGCTSPQSVWHREGATEGELKLVQRECARESEKYEFAFTGGRYSDDLYGSERRAVPSGGSASVYRECMERRGWRRLRETPRS